MIKTPCTSGSLDYPTSLVSQHTGECALQDTPVNIHTCAHTQHHGALRQWVALYDIWSCTETKVFALKCEESSLYPVLTDSFFGCMMVFPCTFCWELLNYPLILDMHGHRWGTWRGWAAVRGVNGPLRLTWLMCQCFSGPILSTQLCLGFWCCCHL